LQGRPLSKVLPPKEGRGGSFPPDKEVIFGRHHRKKKSWKKTSWEGQGYRLSWEVSRGAVYGRGFWGRRVSREGGQPEGTPKGKESERRIVC